MAESTKDCVELFAKVHNGERWEYQRQFFPSKLGGLPAWLDPASLPSEAAFGCRGCAGAMTFVLQVYAPDDEEPSGDAFHRTVFLFACQPCGTQWRAFRSQLPRRNRHYGYHPEAAGTIFPQPDHHMARLCCLACGVPSSKEHDGDAPLPIDCKVQDVSYFSDERSEWRALHPRCQIAVKHKTLEATLPEALLNICEGEIQEPANHLEHERELYRRYQELKQTQTGEDELDESEQQAIESLQQERLVVDHSFERFCRRTTQHDVLYYCRDGTPLWLSDKTSRPRCANVGDRAEASNAVPTCERCGGPRSFEFQVLPQLLVHLKRVRLDFASVVIYTCAASCKLDGAYQEEYVYVEPDVTLAAR